MKRLQILLLPFLLIALSCTESNNMYIQKETVEPAEDIPSIEVEMSELKYNPKKSIWTFNGLLYSGYAHSYFSDGSLKEKVGFLNGRKQNKSISWFSDGHHKGITHYHKGKLHGAKKLWSADSPHILLSHLNYYEGKAHGEQRKWYPTGEKFMTLNMTMGKEEGIQKAFRKNGALYANYEAVNGRIFGLKKAALCFGLENEKIINEI